MYQVIPVIYFCLIHRADFSLKTKNNVRLYSKALYTLADCIVNFFYNANIGFSRTVITVLVASFGVEILLLTCLRLRISSGHRNM